MDVRASELKIGTVVQGAAEKGDPFRTIMAGLGLGPIQTCYVGDDLADLPPLALAGLAACPSDAAVEVQRRRTISPRVLEGAGPSVKSWSWF